VCVREVQQKSTFSCFLLLFFVLSPSLFHFA
jgi:hypothetical protein